MAENSRYELDEDLRFDGAERNPRRGKGCFCAALVVIALGAAAWLYEKRTFIDLNSGREKLERGFGPFVIYREISETDFSKAVERYCKPKPVHWGLALSVGIVRTSCESRRFGSVLAMVHFYTGVQQTYRIPADKYVDRIRGHLGRGDDDSIYCETEWMLQLAGAKLVVSPLCHDWAETRM